MVETIALTFVYLSWLAFCGKRLLTYMQLFQQDDYDTTRFLRLILEKRLFDKRLSILLLAASILWIFIPSAIALLPIIAAFVFITYIEKDPRELGKKKLVMTARARRIFIVALAMLALLGAFWFVLPLPFLWIVCVQLVPLVVVLADTALGPFERATQKKFWIEANDRLNTLQPKVVGITGSFGKTSVKHILGHILKTFAPTLITPGSVNTPMGIARIIRERLEDNHRFFVVEMGAYGPGSIQRLCDLTPPDLGIITAIGQAHYERFKTLDTVAETKFELADAVLARSGKIIFPAEILEFDYVRKTAQANPESCIICGENNFALQSAKQTLDGLAIELLWNGELRIIKAPLYGLQHASNIALAYAAAIELGVPKEHVETALRSVPQIEHRLEVKRQGDGRIFIDDAFNSNPRGFLAALDLLRVIGKDNRKILVTPGMVELGEAHEKEHEIIGRKAGEACDIVLLVKAERIPSFVTGFQSAGAAKQLIKVETFSESSAWIENNKRTGDVILIENDLPDLYESLPKL